MDDVVSSIERATLDAVPPVARCEIGPWLLGLDPGPVRRARSAVPLRHAPDAANVSHRTAIEHRFKAQGLPVLYRLPQIRSFDAFRHALATDGFASSAPVRVQTAVIAATLSAGEAPRASPCVVRVSPKPDDVWSSVFQDQGGDPADAAARLDMLKRATGGAFATALVDGRAVAVGAACFSQNWCGIHSMRTSPAFRNRGLARAVLQGLAQQARDRGIGRAWLQVESGNAAAVALYRSVGFVDAWAYDYWTQLAA